MRAKSSISEIDAQMEKLREKRRSILAKANERFARAAAKAGLAELDIPDNELDAIFEEIADSWSERLRAPVVIARDTSLRANVRRSNALSPEGNVARSTAVRAGVARRVDTAGTAAGSGASRRVSGGCTAGTCAAIRWCCSPVSPSS